MMYLFGANGMLGRYVSSALIGIKGLVPLGSEEFDLCRPATVLKWLELEQIGPEDVIINCAGVIGPRMQVRGLYETIQVNSIFPHLLSDLAETTEVNVIHITTDGVFSGKKGKYSEVDVKDAIDDYGKTKALGDYIKKIADRNHISMEETVKIIYGLESDSDRDDLLMQIPLAYFKKGTTHEWSQLTKVGWEWVFRVMLSKTVQELESQKFNGVECYSLCYFELAGKLMGDLGQILHCMKSGNVFASGDKLAVSQAMALNIINSI